MSNFAELLENEAKNIQPNVSVTENGAVGYKTSGSKLVDCNFALGSMRNMSEDEIWAKFLAAYNENPTLALRWLFFARDLRGGAGERRTFRVIFARLCKENPSVAIRLVKLIPEYGRWDDLIEMMFSGAPRNVCDEVFSVINAQLDEDFRNALNKKPISLLSKWLPSANTSSKETCKRAETLRHMLGWTPREYRKKLSMLRQHIDVVERKMSAQEWDQIKYEGVPSKAAMNYREAFTRHDGDRYGEYLTNVKEGNAKINAGTLFPYDIVSAYRNTRQVDETLEAQWKALPNYVSPDESTLVVVDGSGSMYCGIDSNSHVEAIHVAWALGIYFAERLRGPYRDRFITFSSHPQMVGLRHDLTLRSKLDIIEGYDDCSNTDIKKVFDLVLNTAVKNRLSQKDLPKNILIVSDGEFDGMTWNYDYGPADQALFDAIAEEYRDEGYFLPRLVFWNVNSRTGTIPLTQNDLGVALVSGFSPSIADMVLSGKLDPYGCLVDKLMSERYNPVTEALKE